MDMTRGGPVVAYDQRRCAKDAVKLRIQAPIQRTNNRESSNAINGCYVWDLVVMSSKIWRKHVEPFIASALGGT